MKGEDRTPTKKSGRTRRAVAKRRSLGFAQDKLAALPAAAGSGRIERAHGGMAATKATAHRLKSVLPRATADPSLRTASG